MAAPVKIAMLANAALPSAPGRSKPAEVAPVLTAPAKLEASAGATIDLPIALDGTDGVPARSSIAISGLPDGAKLSHGRPYGATGWNLKSDEIGDLQLSLPDVSHGQTKLAIELLAPHGEALAKAETLLQMSATPEGEPQPLAEPDVAVLDSATGPSVAAPAPDLEPVPAGEGDNADGISTGAEVQPDIDGAQSTEAAAAAATSKPAKTAKPMALASAEDAAEAEEDTVTPSMYVNLRARPTSSAPILGVVPKGARLAVLDRNRGWVQVKHPATAEVGWIYDGSNWAPRRGRRAAKPEAADESFWTRLGRTLAGSSTEQPEQN